MKGYPRRIACLAALAACGGDPTHPPGSGAGNELAFVSERDGYGIYRMRADGSNVVPLLRTSQLPFCLSWSPDGSRIAFSEQRESFDQIFVVEVQTGQLTQLTRGDRFNTCPTWSPSGDRIAYYSGEPDTPGIGYPREFGLFVMTPSGANAVRLGDGVFRPNRLAWSPDSRRIAVGLIDADDRIVFIDARTGAQVGQLPTRGFDITWSPDGGRLAYAHQRGADTEIYVINADGSGERQVTANAAGRYAASLSPRWSPDGRWLAADQVRLITPDPPPRPDVQQVESREIVVFSPDGTGLRVLTRHPGMDISPAWRPVR